MKETKLALGLMSGTSMDGIDLAFIETDGIRILRRGPGATFAYEPHVRRTIVGAVAAARGQQVPGRDDEVFAEAEQALTEAHARAVQRFLADCHVPAGRVDVLGFHGQTVLHRPERRLSIQLGDGPSLAQACGIDVVWDFRAADLAAGGQGAPFAPVYHQALASQSGIELPVVVANIGGVSNVTWIGRDGDMLAFDSGPGNALLDQWAERYMGVAMDKDGQLAARGRADDTAIQAFMRDDFFEKAPPKSLDRNDFSLFLIEGLGVADAAATLTAITAESIARSVEHMPEPPQMWVICGGGSRNPTMMIALRNRLKGKVVTAQTLGWSAEFVEAEAFGFMAVRSLRGLPLSFPRTTGVAKPTSGGVHAPARTASPRRIAAR